MIGFSLSVEAILISPLIKCLIEIDEFVEIGPLEILIINELPGTISNSLGYT